MTQREILNLPDTKFRSNRCKTKLFRSNNNTYTVRGELHGELLFEGGSYFFDAGAERGSYSRKYGIASLKPSCLADFQLQVADDSSMENHNARV